MLAICEKMGRNQPRQDGKMRYLDAQVEEEERTTDGLVDPSFKDLPQQKLGKVLVDQRSF